MTRPSEQALRALYEKHGGNLVRIAQATKKPRSTVQHWYRGLGLGGMGKGGPPSIAPSEDELRRLYQEYDGHISNIAARLGVSGASVSQWMRKLGLMGLGRHKYGSSYPRELPLTVQDGYVVAFSDAHFWDEEKTPAHVALLKVIRKIKPAAVIAAGDILDGAKISRHDPSGFDTVPDLSDELHVCRVHMAEIKRAAQGADTRYCLGNHCARLSRYIAQHAPELIDIEGARLEHYFLGWTFSWSVRINDQLLVMHRYRGGQHATFQNLMRAGMSIATGHLHSQRVYPFTDARGTRYGVDLGCLADPHGPQFGYTEANPLDWRSGFAVFEFRDAKLLPPQLVTVLDDGSVYWQRNERLI
jgi:hypothetical protein